MCAGGAIAEKCPLLPQQDLAWVDEYSVVTGKWLLSLFQSGLCGGEGNGLIFEKGECEMHFETIIVVTQILKFQALGVGGQGGKLKWSLGAVQGALPEYLGAAAIFHVLKRHLEFDVSHTVDSSILRGGY